MASVRPRQYDPQSRAAAITLLERIAAAGERSADALQRIASVLERGHRHTDEYRGVFLDAKFPNGIPTDRWARRGRG